MQSHCLREEVQREAFREEVQREAFRVVVPGVASAVAWTWGAAWGAWRVEVRGDHSEFLKPLAVGDRPAAHHLGQT
tara:strand:+ start:975 stop:1202 length:228 start_codon:yes stop_codon:yes gene_type:complete